MYYNTITGAEKELPKDIPPFKGLIIPRDADKYIAAGWMIDPIVPFVVPDGYVVIAGTRRIEIEDNVPYEKWDVETNAEAEARRASEKDAQETAQADYDLWEDTTKAFIKLMVKELNTLRGLHSLAPRTADQVKAALKAEMAE